jgi:hypothetical protein
MPAQGGAQPGVAGPSFGMSFGPGGRPRIGFQGGDFSLNGLIGAVTGKGFANPRLMGAGFFGLGALFGIGNFVLLFVLNYYFPYFLILSPPFSLAGLFLLATGQPKANDDGSPAPGWARAGVGVMLGIGFLLGLGMTFFIHWV